MSTDATRVTVDLDALYRRLGRVQSVVGAVAAALFWGWLLARWLNDWVLPPGWGVAPKTPFLPADAFAPVSTELAFAVQYLPVLAQGVFLTLLLTVTSIALGFPLAVAVSVARVYGDRTAYLALGFTELIRGTPLIAQLFVIYYGLNLTGVVAGVPFVGTGFVPGAAVWVAVVGFTINSAAYQAEYLRSALQSVQAGQLTAARAVGLSKLEALRYVVLPQGLRLAIPGWSNELVYLIKYSSLATFITVPELFYVAEDLASSNFRYTGVFTLVALLYLGMVLTAAKLSTLLEERVAIPGVGTGGRR